jgi:hypothetical protein
MVEELELSRPLRDKIYLKCLNLEFTRVVLNLRRAISSIAEVTEEVIEYEPCSLGCSRCFASPYRI